MGFPGGYEAFVELAERRLAAGGGTGSPVEGGSHRGAPAGDGSCSLQLATVVIERGKTDQGGDGTACDAAELGRQREKGDCRDVLDALERLDLGKQAGDLADRLEDEGTGLLDLLRDQRQALAVLGLEEAAAKHVDPIAEGHALVDQAAAVAHQLGQALACRVEGSGMVSAASAWRA